MTPTKKQKTFIVVFGILAVIFMVPILSTSFSTSSFDEQNFISEKNTPLPKAKELISSEKKITDFETADHSSPALEKPLERPKEVSCDDFSVVVMKDFFNVKVTVNDVIPESTVTPQFASNLFRCLPQINGRFTTYDNDPETLRQLNEFGSYVYVDNNYISYEDLRFVDLEHKEMFYNDANDEKIKVLFYSLILSNDLSELAFGKFDISINFKNLESAKSANELIKSYSKYY